MPFDRNIGSVDRVIRLISGLAAIAVAFWLGHRAWAWLGALLLLTALASRCPLYPIFGWSTCKRI